MLVPFQDNDREELNGQLCLEPRMGIMPLVNCAKPRLVDVRKTPYCANRVKAWKALSVGEKRDSEVKAWKATSFTSGVRA